MKNLLKIPRRLLSGPIVGVVTALMCASVSVTTFAETPLEPKAFVYTELQLSAPFEAIPWQKLNNVIKKQPGFINKTWLSGVGNNSVGGFYAFDSVDGAQRFVTEYFPNEAKGLGVAQTTRVFNATATAEASRNAGSVYYGAKLSQSPGAYVYTEFQVRVPSFQKKSWVRSNSELSNHPGLLTKTWLIGLSTETIGGFFAFDTLGNAKSFALNYIPSEAKSMKSAFYTRIFDASKTDVASQSMASPFYLK